jgi:hypothetical protein
MLHVRLKVNQAGTCHHTPFPFRAQRPLLRTQKCPAGTVVLDRFDRPASRAQRESWVGSIHEEEGGNPFPDPRPSWLQFSGLLGLVGSIASPRSFSKENFSQNESIQDCLPETAL